jgi:hypothetical protein
MNHTCKSPRVSEGDMLTPGNLVWLEYYSTLSDVLNVEHIALTFVQAFAPDAYLPERT